MNANLQTVWAMARNTFYGLCMQMFFISILSAHTSDAQTSLRDIRLSIQINGQTLKEVFAKLEHQTDFTFSYNDAQVDENKRLRVTPEDESLYHLLKAIAQKSELGFKRIKGTIFVRGRKPFEALVEDELFGQEITITGKITDEKGEGFPGAAVRVKGTTIGATTDLDGNYQLTNVPEEAVLVVSFIGYETQEVKVNRRTVINVTLQQASKELEEVVVTGFGDVSKRLYTGVSQKLDIQEVKVEGIGDVSQMLQGRAAGVNVQSVSGTFGAGPRITIRGASSIFGDGKPLWVIDGVVQDDLVNLSAEDLVSGNINTLIGSAVAGLNPNDIESFEILKDAAATALYGTRSLNGVIVITTKRGKKNTPLNFSYSGEFTIRDIPNYSQADILNSKENMSVLQEAVNKGLIDVTTIGQNRFSGVYGIMANRINTYDKNREAFLLPNTPEAKAEFLKVYERANTNWFDVLFKERAFTQNHTISFSGGGEKNRFYASLSYYTDPGWAISDNVRRATANLRNTFLMKRKAELTFSLLGSYREQLAPGAFNRQADNVYGTVSRDFDINPYSYALNTSRTLRPRDEQGNLEYYTYNWAPMNILNEAKNNFTQLNVQDVKFQMDFNIPLWKDKLKYAFTGAVRYANSVREHQMTEFSNVAKAYRAADNTVIRRQNTFLWTDAQNLTALPLVVLPKGGFYNRGNIFLRTFYLRNTLTFSGTFNNKHDIDVFLGQEIRGVERKNHSFNGYGIIYSKANTVFTDPNMFQKVIQGGGRYFDLRFGKERTVSFFSRLTYGLDGKYFLSLTGNLNASNQQGIKNGQIQWTPTYTASGKWNVKEESFLQNVRSVTNFDVRGSYGLTANTGIASNVLPVFFDYVTHGRFSVSDRESGIRISNLQNDDLTWEKQFETNIGLDLGLFSNRINLTADVYQRKGFDLIDYVTTSGIGGQALKAINNADMVTRGIEVSLRTTNLELGDFRWTSTVNFSVFDQKVTQINNRPTLLDAVDDTGTHFVGYPRNALFSIRFNGLTDQGHPSYDTPSGINFQDRGLTLKAEGGKEGLLTYLKYEGPIEPNQSLSLQNTFTYKNWSLGIFISASGGNKIRLPVIYTGNFSDQDVYSKSLINRWVSPGDEKITNIPVIPNDRQWQQNGVGLVRAYNAYNFSTERVADGTFVRLRTINLSYQLPKRILKKFGLTRLTISGLVQNPWLIYSDKKLNGVDPEFYNSGGVALPIIRQYTVSLNLGI